MTKLSALKIGFITLTVLACWTSTSHAVGTIISPGWSLYDTSNFTTIAGQQFIGVPIGSYNFGGAIGTQNIGDTDTIIQRTSTILAPSIPGTAAPSPITMTDLQLETIAPTSAFGPLDFYFITLESARGVPVSSGSLTATFNMANGTFSSSIDVFYDIRQGSLTGPIVFSSDATVTTTDDPWQRLADSANDVAISGVNSNLNGLNTATDFWNSGISLYSGINYSQDLAPAVVAVPEPSSIVLAALGLSGFFCLRKRRSS